MAGSVCSSLTEAGSLGTAAGLEAHLHVAGRVGRLAGRVPIGQRAGALRGLPVGQRMRRMRREGRPALLAAKATCAPDVSPSRASYALQLICSLDHWPGCDRAKEVLPVDNAEHAYHTPAATKQHSS